MISNGRVMPAAISTPVATAVRNSPIRCGECRLIFMTPVDIRKPDMRVSSQASSGEK